MTTGVNETPAERPVKACSPLQIVIWPDPLLTKMCAPVSEVDIGALRTGEQTSLRELLDGMALTLRLTGGGGLAAPQVGRLVRVICVRVLRQEVSPGDAGVPKEREEVLHLLNPVVTYCSDGFMQVNEGCLSFPGVTVPTQRRSCCRVSAIGFDGNPVELGGDGLLAVALQHEIDHLDGRTLVEHVSSLRRSLIRQRLTKQKKRGLRYNLQEAIQ